MAFSDLSFLILLFVGFVVVGLVSWWFSFWFCFRCVGGWLGGGRFFCVFWFWCGFLVCGF